MLAAFIEHANNPVRKRFPAVALMGAGSSTLNGQHRVEEQHALLRPGFQAAANIIEMVVCVTELGIDLFEYIYQRRWLGRAGLHRKTQTMRLIRSVIGILADDDNFDLRHRREIECGENPLTAWIDNLS